MRGESQNRERVCEKHQELKYEIHKENEMITEAINSFHLWFIKSQSKKSASVIDRLSGGSILEIGSGHGFIGFELMSLKREIVMSDYNPCRNDIIHCDAHATLFADNSFDLIVCSNTLEHLHSPAVALKEMRRVGKKLYLTWTPWHSPFGGHEFSPLHYFGRTKGSIHQLGTNLFKTTVKETLLQLEQAGWKIISVRPRYWPALKFLSRWHWTREWATWNVEIICK
jgi:SAM-dependent methyltransferase